MASPSRELLDFAVASSPMPGQSVCGDRELVCAFESGALLAVADGLGHGPEAAAAAAAAIACLSSHPRDPLEALLARCHEALRGTRGIALSLASLDAAAETMTWVAIGNVEGLLVRAGGGRRPGAKEWIVARGGVVGFSLPQARPVTLGIQQGDRLILATDGIGDGFTACVTLGGSSRETAEQILARFCKGTDDALVLVATYLGRPVAGG